MNGIYVIRMIKFGFGFGLEVRGYGYEGDLEGWEDVEGAMWKGRCVVWVQKVRGGGMYMLLGYEWFIAEGGLWRALLLVSLR